MRSKSWSLLVLAALLAQPLVVRSAEPERALVPDHAIVPDHSIVPAFERFHARVAPTDGAPDRGAADAKDLARGGQLLLGELNCVACHAVPGEANSRILPKQAPLLENVGSRARPDFIRSLLLDPQAVKPGTTMPALLTSGTDTERAAQADALVHFLVGANAVVEAAAVSQSVTRGEGLFHQVGCVACHDRQDGKSPPGIDSMPLGPLGQKYSLPSLQQFLADPLAVRPSGRMPHLNLTADESRDIAAYLLRDLVVAPNLRYEFFEGSWDKLPDFTTLKPKAAGETSGFSLNFGRSDNFALRFTGHLQIAREGQYRFFLGSDDGSRLIVDGNELVRVDGIHPYQEQVGRVFLTKGAHKLVVEYFEQGGEEVLRLEMDGPGVNRQSADSFITLDAQPPVDVSRPSFSFDPVKAEQGKALFARLGCAACHAPGGNSPPAPTRAGPALASLDATRGCLAPEPASTPRYALSARQREAIGAALSAERAARGQGDANRVEPSAAEVVERTFTTFQCYACHQRGDRGGVTEARNASFQSNQPEMGDEGRIPPLLTGVGAKLQRDWLQHIFANGAKDRPYMFTRMPKFGLRNVGHLVDALERADPQVEYRRVEPGVSMGAFKATGRKLVGAQGYSCIKCHTWGNVPATGIQSIGMTTMTRRLRESWFHAYVLDPPAFRPGTRMPSAWPMGQTLLPDVLGGDTARQIHSVWSFLADGDKAAIPLGLGRDPIELVAVDEPVIYRNFLEGAGPRAIGVGYPQRINLAFDANDLRLALVWQGSFIDAARHWTDRGVGFQSPLGDNVLKLPAGVHFATLATDDEAWPAGSARKLGYQFRGYRLNPRREPVFLYEVAGVRVEDYPRPLGSSEQGRLLRSLTLSSSSGPRKLWFRAAAGGKIEELPGGGYRVDGQWQVRITAGDASPRVRSANNGQELLVPLNVGAEVINLIQEIQW